MPDVFVKTSDGKFNTLVELADTAVACQADGNREIVAFFLQAWLCLLADSPLVERSNSYKPRKVFSRFKREILSRPVLDSIVLYSTLADRILKGCKNTGEFTETGEWIHEMADTPIFREYRSWYLSGDPVLLHFIISFLWFGKKLDYDDEELRTVAFHRWQKVEERLSTLELPSTLVDGLRIIIRSMLPPRKLQFLGPSFGPGSVAEKGVTGRINKSVNLLRDKYIEYAFSRHTIFHGEQTGFLFSDVITEEWNKANKTSRRCSRLHLVPKTVKTARTICMQPNTTMYFEQSYARHLRTVMSSGWCKRFVDLSDQSRNRVLSRYGSATTLIDTIDLSDASDTVHVDLVKRIFPREILFFLKALRISDVQLPDKTIVGVRKFAPMGSALCFPVQCITFLSVLIYSAMQYVSDVLPGVEIDLEDSHLRDPAMFVEQFISRHSRYFSARSKILTEAAVYGDDIVCDSRLTPFIIHNLHKLGFVVNESKSFTGGDAVRESCGGYYYCGDDVTPLLFRVKRWSKSKDTKGVLSIIAAINAAGDHRFFNLKRGLTQFLLWSGVAGNVKPAPILFTPNREIGGGIFHPDPKNLHLQRKRVNPDLQRDEVRCLMVTPGDRRLPRKTQVYSYEQYLYNQWWISRGPLAEVSPLPMENRRVDDEYVNQSGHHDPGPTRLSWKWMPA